MITSRGRILQGMAAVASVVALAGCAATEAPGPGPSGDPPTTAAATAPSAAAPGPQEVVNGFPVVVDPGAVHLPIEAYLPSGEQTRAFHAASTILVNQCMVTLGFAAQPLPGPYSAADAVVASLTARRYFVASPDQAAHYGYHTGLTPEFVAQQKELEARSAQAQTPGSAGEEEALRRAMTGQAPDGTPVSDGSVPPDGCLGQANRTLHDDPGDIQWSEAARTIQGQSFDVAMADPRVQARDRTVVGVHG